MSELLSSNFLKSFFIINFTIYPLLYICGLLVIHKGLRVNYSRKIYHLVVIFFPIYIRLLFPIDPSPITFLFNIFMTILNLATYTYFLRSRVRIFDVMFAGLDRPEDRPYTLIWLTTQIVGLYIVIVPLAIYWESLGITELLFIPLFINGLGDGLAEPVGVTWGKHKYQTRALFTKKRYTRSLEGSACVLISGFIAIFIMQDSFTVSQLWVAYLTIPILMTLTEAFSPHTMDTPFFFLTGGIVLTCITQFV